MEEYETTDMNLAVVLYTLGKKIAGIGNKTASQRIFVFVDDGTIEGIRLKFLNRELLVEPMAFWEAAKVMKQFLYGSSGK